METIPNSWATPAPVKAVFFDIDGTLAELGTFEIVPSAIRALEQLRARGVRCFVASGRGPADLAGFPMELFDGAAMFNGQYCTIAGELVHDLRFSAESLDSIFAFAQNTDRALTVQGLSGLYSVRRTETFMRVYAMALDRFPLTDVDAIDRSVIYQSTAECALGEEDALAAQLVGCETARWNPFFVDIIPAGGGKGRGIRAMLDHLGFSPNEAIAFGDSQNDIPMFRACGTSIAMGNGSQDVKTAATYVTDGIGDDGVLNAFVRLGLI